MVSKDEVIDKLINPYRSHIHNKTLKRKMNRAVDGGGSKTLIKYYGCHSCALKDHCEYYPHANRICVRRAKLYVEYFKAGKSDIVPLMIDQLAKLSVERDIEHEKGMVHGKLTDEFFRLNYLCMQLQERIHKATEGTKLRVEHTWLDELRSAVNVTRRVIDEHEDSNRDNKGTTPELPGKVPESKD